MQHELAVNSNHPLYPKNMTILQIKMFILENLKVAESDLEFMNEQQIMEIYLELSAGIEGMKSKNQSIKSEGKQKNKDFAPQQVSVKVSLIQPEQSKLINNNIQQASQPSRRESNKFQKPLSPPIVIDEQEQQIKGRQRLTKNSEKSNNFHENNHRDHQASHDYHQKREEYFPRLAVRQAHIFNTKYRLQFALNNYEYISKHVLQSTGLKQLTIEQIEKKLSCFSLQRVRQIKQILVEIFPDCEQKILGRTQRLFFQDLCKLCLQSTLQFRAVKQNFEYDNMMQEVEQKKYSIKVNRNLYLPGIQKKHLAKARQIKAYNYRNLFNLNNKNSKKIQINNSKNPNTSVEKNRYPITKVLISKIYQTVQQVYSESQAEINEQMNIEKQMVQEPPQQNSLTWKRDKSSFEEKISLQDKQEKYNFQQLCSQSNQIKGLECRKLVSKLSQEINDIADPRVIEWVQELKRLCQKFQEQITNQPQKNIEVVHTYEGQL